MPYRPGVLFEGMLDAGAEERVDRACDAIVPLALAAGRVLAGTKRDCPCAVAMERYRRGGRIGADFRTWVAAPKRRRE
jgi:hypothetical protein